MTRFFAPSFAFRLNQAALLLILVLLIATPVRSHVVIAALMLYSIGYLVAHRRTWAMSTFDWLVVVILSSLLLARLPIFVMDDYTSRYLSPGFHMLALVPIYLMLRHLVTPENMRQLRGYMEWGVIIGSLGALSVALYQTQVLGYYRADGFLFSINLSYLSCAMAFLAACLIRDGRYQRWLLAAALAATVTCVLTLARGGIFALPLLLVLLLYLNADRLGWKLVITPLAGLLAIALLSYLTLPNVERRVEYTVAEFTNLMDGNVEAAVSSGGRLQLWTAASHAFMERPLIGLGYDEREALNAKLVEQGVITEWVLGVSRGHAHSQYFEMAATGGVLGLIALFGYLIVPGIYHAQLYWRDKSNSYAMTALVFTTGFTIFCLTEAAIHHEMMVAFYAYMQVVLLVMAWNHTKATTASSKPLALRRAL